MKKFYVVLGQFETMVMAATDYQACMIAFRKYMEFESDILPSLFYVSERGFRGPEETVTRQLITPHEGDSIIDGSIVIGLHNQSRQYEKDWND